VFTVVAGWGSEVASVFVFFFFSSEGGWLAGLVNMGLGLGYSVCPFFKIPPLHMAYGWRFTYIEISIRAIQENLAIIIAEIVFYNQHQQILYLWYFILQ
jgi:hypothetical protein